MRLIESRVNGDFACANNLGLHEIGFGPSQTSNFNTPNLSNCVLLNLDTLLPPSALQDMPAFMDVHPEVGAAQWQTGSSLSRFGIDRIGLAMGSNSFRRGDQVLHSRPQESVKIMEATQ